MHECERLLGAVRGREVHEFIEEATASACPCLAGRPCPLKQDGGESVLLTLGLRRVS